MRPSSLFLHSFALFCFVSSVISTPIFLLDSGSEPDQSDQSSPAADSSPALPSSNLVVAHYMVGNTYKYDVEDWLSEIELACATGFDGFALNIGSDAWQGDQCQNAFDAADRCNCPFKLFISFDMSSIPCSTDGDAKSIQDYIIKYQTRQGYLRIDGKPLVSAFSGQDCPFGQAGWNNAIKPSDASEQVNFLPAFFVDPSSFQSWKVIDGIFNWNAAWPNGNKPIDFKSDSTWIDDLKPGSIYMAGVSPWFFTHYSRDTYNKNFIYQCDDWMFNRRWEELFNHRDKVDIVQLITWNDFGESHYVGPVRAHTSQPNSQAWVDGFDHTGWLDLFAYYIQAFKTGIYPTTTQDRIFLWARLYPANATAMSDPVGKPANWEWTKDFVWAIFFLSEPADVILQCGSDSQTTTNVPAGLFKAKFPLVDTGDISAYISREGEFVVSLEPEGMRFTRDPQATYNFNVVVAASPSN